MKTLNVTTAIYLDTRRTLKDNSFPIKLRITHKRKTRLYKTSFSSSIKDFEKITKTANPKGDLKDLKLILGELESEALNIINKLPSFSFELFEKKYNSDKGNASDLFFQFETIIKNLRKEERIGSANAYLCAYNSIKDFHSKNQLDIHNITPQYLKDYERWMQSAGKSLTTVGIYLRCVRHLFNKAISEEAIAKELYPFGKNKYQIPAPRSIKKALSLKEIKNLYEYKAEEGSPEQMYRDLWFFSYLCNGMNIKDICLLKHKDIQGKHIYFNREKTKNSNRNSKPVDVVLIDEIQSILDKWAAIKVSPEDYLFPFIKKDQSAEQIISTTKQLTKMINKYMRLIATKVGIEKNITTYWARHSYATVLKRSNVGLPFISEALGHKNLKTTENYLDSFEDDTKQEIAKKLLDF